MLEKFSKTSDCCVAGKKLVNIAASLGMKAVFTEQILSTAGRTGQFKPKILNFLFLLLPPCLSCSFSLPVFSCLQLLVATDFGPSGHWMRLTYRNASLRSCTNLKMAQHAKQSWRLLLQELSGDWKCGKDKLRKKENEIEKRNKTTARSENEL